MNNKVLIIQTDPMQARRLEHLLFDHGHSSQSTRNAEEAMRYIESKGHPLLVITELALPGADGFELLAWLRARFSAKDCPAVVVSAFPELMSNALRQKSDLGVGAVISTKATAIQLAKIFEDTLRAAGERREQLMRVAFKPPANLNAGVQAGQAEIKAKETKRLAKIAALRLDRNLPEHEALQKLAVEMAKTFDFSLALITLAQEQRQWYRAATSSAGKLLLDKATAADWAFCASLAEADPALTVAVPNAKAHPTFKASPLALQGLVGAYFGTPILLSDGQLLGSLGLADAKAHLLEPEVLELLRTLARHVAGELELSRQVHALKKDLSVQWDKALRSEDHLEMLREVLAQLQLGVLLHDRHGKILLASHRLNNMTQMGPEMEGRPIAEFEKGLMKLIDEPGELRERLHGDTEGPYSAMEIFETQRPQRQILRWTARPIQLKDGWCQFLSYEDITAEIDLATQQERLALVDPLTGLLNRRGAEEEGARESERARRKQRNYCVMILEPDGFKGLNDEHGFDAGDAVLRSMAQVLRKNLRLMDRPARWTGKKFLVLLPETSEPDAKLVAKRVRDAIADVQDAPAYSASCGIAHCGKDPEFKAVVAQATKRLATASAKS